MSHQENEIRLREDVAGLQLALDSIDSSADQEEEKRILELMLIMLERVENEIQQRLERLA